MGAVALWPLAGALCAELLMRGTIVCLIASAIVAAMLATVAHFELFCEALTCAGIISASAGFAMDLLVSHFSGWGLIAGLAGTGIVCSLMACGLLL